MENGKYYDADYFESGIAAGKSLYENYRWIPELTIPMAMTIIDHLNIKRTDLILDYGCAKAYLVKALRLLHRQAWGVDISSYALENCDSDVRRYCAEIPTDFAMAHPLEGNKMPSVYDFCIAKDVFEHIPSYLLRRVLFNIPSTILFVVIPLGDGEKFNIPAFHFDKSHLHAWTIQQWVEFFSVCDWEVISTTIRIPGIKDNWVSHSDGHGFFTLRKTSFDYTE